METPGQQKPLFKVQNVSKGDRVGLTKEGYLLAVTDQGEQLQLLPDGNSFNFLEGLIYKKI